MTKLITVGISFYNNEKTLELAILSVLNQTYQNIELLLVDDGSKDSSLDIAKKFERRDSRVKVFSDGMNKGLIKRLNEIIELANGEFIARMDSDDLIDSSKFEKQIAAFENDPRIDVSTTGLASVDSTLTPLGKRCCLNKSPNIFAVFKNGEDLLHASMLAKKAWWLKNKYLIQFERAEDRELFTRTIKTSCYRIIPEPLYYYRDVENISLKKFIISYQSERKATFKNWKSNITFPQMIYLILRSFLKSIIIRIYFFLNLQDRIFTKGNDPLSNAEKTRILGEIKKITSFQEKLKI